MQNLVALDRAPGGAPRAALITDLRATAELGVLSDKFGALRGAGDRQRARSVQYRRPAAVGPRARAGHPLARVCAAWRSSAPGYLLLRAGGRAPAT